MPLAPLLSQRVKATRFYRVSLKEALDRRDERSDKSNADGATFWLTALRRNRSGWESARSALVLVRVIV
jgi:hypothetical protein